MVAVATLTVTTACAPISDNHRGRSRRVHEGPAGHAVSGLPHIGTDQPVYPPWYLGDNPASGEGFEAAIAYAVAAKMNYARDHVRWVRVPFNAALAPSPKTFDANLSEFSITSSARPRWTSLRRIST